MILLQTLRYKFLCHPDSVYIFTLGLEPYEDLYWGYELSPAYCYFQNEPSVAYCYVGHGWCLFCISRN